LLEAQLNALLAPISDALAGESPSTFRRETEVLRVLSEELMRGRYFDEARFPEMRSAWRDLLPKIPGLILGNARNLAGAVSNSVYRLTLASPSAPKRWLAIMEQVGPRCRNIETFLEIGKIAAWRAGMAEYRDAALEILREIDPALAVYALGLKPSAELPAISAILEQMERDPWRHPETFGKQPDRRCLAVVSVVGSFRGFGGEFITPPRVTNHSGEFILSDVESEWTLTADCFGSRLHRNRIEGSRPVAWGKPGLTLSNSGKVTKGNLTAEFSRLAQASSHASNATTLAVTLPHSHSVFLVAEADIEALS